MATNQYLPFATSDNANVLTSDEYNNLSARGNGFQSGVASSTQVNTPIRQATVIASAVAQYIADTSNTDMLDDGNVSSVVSALKNTINNSSSDKLPLTGGTLSGDLTAPNITARTSLTVSSAKATYSATGLNFDKPLLINGSSVLKAGDGGLYAKSPLLTAGTDFSSDLVTNNNQIFTLSGRYVGTPDDTASWGGVLEVKRRLYDASTACILTIKFNNRTYEKEGNKSSGNWVWGSWREIITTANVSSYQGLGYGQTWQNVTSSRKVNVAYTNDTGKPIMLSILITKTGDSSSYFTVDGISLLVSGNLGDTAERPFSLIIPVGSTYMATESFRSWNELR